MEQRNAGGHLLVYIIERNEDPTRMDLSFSKFLNFLINVVPLPVSIRSVHASSGALKMRKRHIPEAGTRT